MLSCVWEEEEQQGRGSPLGENPSLLTMCWVAPSLQSLLKKVRTMCYLWSFSADDATCAWISGEHFHLSLRGAGSSLTESARTNFLELSFLLVCERKVIKLTVRVYLSNTAFLAGEWLVSSSWTGLSGPVHQGKFVAGGNFPGPERVQ